MYLLQLPNEIPRLLDQGGLGHLGQLCVQLAMKFIELLCLILHALSLAQKCEQFILELRV